MNDENYLGCFECTHFHVCKLYTDYKKSLGELSSLQGANNLSKICDFYEIDQEPEE